LKIHESYLEILDGFYEPITDYAKARAYQRGQIVWAYPVYPLVAERIYGLKMKTEDDDHEDFRLHSFSIKRVKHLRDFRELKRGRPIKDLKLGTDEYLLVMKAKKRPAIFWNKVIMRWADGTEADYSLLIPIFGIDKEYQDTIFKTACFDYKESFYIPACNDYTTKDGAAHFEKTQIFPMKYIEPFGGNLNPVPGVLLNEMVMWVFYKHWCDFWNCCVNDEDKKDEQDIRDIIREELVKKVGSN